MLSGLVVTPSAPQFLIMAFMYDLPPNSMTGELISHATRTVWREEGAKAVRHRRRCPPLRWVLIAVLWLVAAGGEVCAAGAAVGAAARGAPHRAARPGR